MDNDFPAVMANGGGKTFLSGFVKGMNKYSQAGTDVDDMGNEVQTVERQGLRYTELLAPLVKAVQELSARVTALEG